MFLDVARVEASQSCCFVVSIFLGWKWKRVVSSSEDLVLYLGETALLTKTPFA